MPVLGAVPFVVVLPSAGVRTFDPVDKRKLLRRKAVQRSRHANYRDKKRMVVLVAECNHVWKMDGVCMKCDEPVNKRVCHSDAQGR